MEIKKRLKIIAILLFIYTLGFSQTVEARKLSVITTTPDLASIAKEVGRERVKVESLAKGYQDPHFVDPKPSFILKLNRADLLILNGLALETGWLPPLITGSRNPKITSKDAEGYLDASTLIPDILGKAMIKVDRSMGDVHPEGNPHYLLDPRNGVAVARGIAEKLGTLDQENYSFYISNYKEFEQKIIKKIAQWEEALSPLRNSRIITYHKTWTYFNQWAGFQEFDTIEPKPGIPPSPSHLARLLKRAKTANIKFVIAANYYPEKTAKVVAKKLGIPFLPLPVMAEGTKAVDSYYDLFDIIVYQITHSVEID